MNTTDENWFHMIVCYGHKKSKISVMCKKKLSIGTLRLSRNTTQSALKNIPQIWTISLPFQVVCKIVCNGFVKLRVEGDFHWWYLSLLSAVLVLVHVFPNIRALSKAKKTHIGKYSTHSVTLVLHITNRENDHLMGFSNFSWACIIGRIDKFKKSDRAVFFPVFFVRAKWRLNLKLFWWCGFFKIMQKLNKNTLVYISMMMKIGLLFCTYTSTSLYRIIRGDCYSFRIFYFGNWLQAVLI